MNTLPTPGPWCWSTVGGGHPILVTVHGGAKVVLGACGIKAHRCSVVHRSPTGVLVPVDPESPDARLIAAAPDLLAACIPAIEFLAAMDAWNLAEQTLNGTLDRYKPDPVLAGMRAAVAKATGEGRP